MGYSIWWEKEGHDEEQFARLLCSDVMYSQFVIKLNITFISVDIYALSYPISYIHRT